MLYKRNHCTTMLTIKSQTLRTIQTTPHQLHRIPQTEADLASSTSLTYTDPAKGTVLVDESTSQL